MHTDLAAYRRGTNATQMVISTLESCLDAKGGSRRGPGDSECVHKYNSRRLVKSLSACASRSVLSIRSLSVLISIVRRCEAYFLHPSTALHLHPLSFISNYLQATMKTFASAVSLALCATNALASAPSVSGTEWKKTLFLDDFTGGSGSAPSSSNWIMQTGTAYPGGPAQWGTFEVETYTKSGTNVRQGGNGNLLITPVKSSSGQWTSARIETVRNDFAPPAGGKLRIESRIKIPNVTGSNGLGYWPAFWAIGGDFRSNRTNWPAVGEIDIMENVNGGSSVYNVLHCVSPIYWHTACSKTLLT